MRGCGVSAQGTKVRPPSVESNTDTAHSAAVQVDATADQHRSARAAAANALKRPAPDRHRRRERRSRVARHRDAVHAERDHAQIKDVRVVRIDGQDAEFVGAEAASTSRSIQVLAAVARTQQVGMAARRRVHRHGDDHRVAARDLDADDVRPARRRVERRRAERRAPVNRFEHRGRRHVAGVQSTVAATASNASRVGAIDEEVARDHVDERAAGALPRARPVVRKRQPFRRGQRVEAIARRRSTP